MSEHDGYMVAHFPSSQGSKALLCVVIGRSFQIDRAEGKCTPEDESAPLAQIDELYEGKNPAKSSLKRASDFEPIKPRVDLVLTGTAHAPGGKPLASWSVLFRVGRWAKKLQIVGPRICKFVPPKKKGKKKEQKSPRFTEPEPIAKVALRYENAFGGTGVFIPDDKEAFLAAKEKAQEVEARAKAKTVTPEPPAPEVPEMSDEDWDNAGAAPVRSSKSDGRILSDAPGSAGVSLEPEHLSSPGEGTLELDLDQLAAEVSEGGGSESGERRGDREGTPILELAEAGNERVVEGGWSEPLEPDKSKTKPEPEVDEEDSEFPRIGCRSNPLGKGFAISHEREVIDGLPLPLIEDPENPTKPEDIPCNLLELDSAPLPAGFGPVPRSWTPRASFAGLNPEQQEEVRSRVDEYILSLDPEDPDDKAAIMAMADQEFPVHDPRVYNFAPEDQQLGVIKGNELVRVEGVSPDGPLEFRLPGRFPLATLDRGQGEELLGLSLDTVEVDTDEDRVILVWRGRAEMESEAELLDYPHIRVRVEDFDTESARAKQAKPRKEGGTDVLEIAGLEEPSESDGAPTPGTGAKSDKGAWKVGEDRVVSPLSDVSEVEDAGDRVKAAENAERQKRRGEVLALRDRLQETEEAKSTKKSRKKTPKTPK